jgi:capsular polysaccharide export protein
LFGDCRPLHKAAIPIAARHGVTVHVFEEGYMRPDWVTLEVGGVNGLSNLPRDPDTYLELAANLPAMPEAMEDVPSSFGRRAREDVAYNIVATLLSPLYPGYRTHRPWHPLVEYSGWIRKLATQSAARRRSDQVLAELAASHRPFFLFPLQLDCDFQIRDYSPYGGMLSVIDLVLSSFAEHAPAEMLLVVKAHPLDNGLRDWRRIVMRQAQDRRTLDRVVYVEAGDIGPLARGATGLITVNSTSGTLALAHGVPVMTLGKAVYDIPRVTHQGSLNSFWSRPERPDAEVFDAMRRVLVHCCMIRGGFFSEAGLAMLVDAALRRMELTLPSAFRQPYGASLLAEMDAMLISGARA